MAQTKSTKKFEKRHLQETLKRRNESKKIKQRHQLKAKKQAKRAHNAESNELESHDHPAAKAQNGTAASEKPFEDMSVDDLFAGGFQAAKPTGKTKAQNRPGKRKRAEADEEDDNASVDSVEARAVSDASDKSDVEDGDELKAHMKELDALSEKDPEFYKYLKDNDPELLDAPGGPSLDEVAELSEEGNDITGGKGKEARDNSEVTTATVKRWSQSLDEKRSLRVMQQVVLAFRAAAHVNDEESRAFRYSITDANAYHDLLLCALNQVPKVLNHHVPVKRSHHGRETVPTDTKQFRNLTTLLKAHAGAILHLISSLSDAATSRSALNSLLALVPYILSFKKLVRDVVRTVAGMWADPAQTEAVRITAFLVLQSLNKNGDSAIKETVLKTAYQALLKGARATSVYTLSAINLMKNSAVDLWAQPLPTGSKEKDKEAANVPYTSAFTLIRALAIHLRQSIKHNANEAYKAVYNWQYVHALDFWSRVLSTQCNSFNEATAGRESPLRPLIYPLTQVTLGALRLIPTAAYFPLRFHCTRALLRLSAATDTFIPLGASLYEVLNSAEMRKPPKPSTIKPLDFDTSIRAPKSYLKSRTYQDGVGEQVVELLGEFFTVWCRNIAFPELALPVVVMLKRWLKDVNPFVPKNLQNGAGRGKISKKGLKDGKGNKNSKVDSGVRLLVGKIEANSRFIEEKRRKVDFSPKDRSQVERFEKELEWNRTPLGAFVEGQRKQREERRKILEEARKVEAEQRGKQRDKRGGDEDYNEDMEDEVEPELEVEVDDENEELEDESEGGVESE